jgi:RNA processing factor Prp31
MRWKLLALVMVSTTGLAADFATTALMESQTRLRDAILGVWNTDKALCTIQHQQNACQDYYLVTVQLKTVDSKIALTRLESKVRSAQAKEMIAEAVEKLDDLDSIIDEIKEKLDE